MQIKELEKAQLVDLKLQSDYIAALKDTMDKDCQANGNFVSLCEATRMLGVSRQMVSSLVNRGRLFGVVGNKLWIYVPSIEDRIKYIKKHGKPTRGGARKKGQKNTFNWLLDKFPDLSERVGGTK